LSSVLSIPSNVMLAVGIRGVVIKTKCPDNQQKASSKLGSEMLVNFYLTARHGIPEDSTLDNVITYRIFFNMHPK
jgi:hypothetical protein